MAKIITLGEIMLRLSPPGHQRFIQTDSFEANYGGAEANVAASLAQFGHVVSFISKVPSHAIGEAAIGTLKKAGVHCGHVARGGERLGIYYLENGASIRPASVIYDRKGAAFTTVLPEEFDFDQILHDADLFHVSGITPVLSPQTATLTMESLKKAREYHVTVSFDLNYRAKLWTENVPEKQALLSQMMEYTDICFGNARDAALCLGYTRGGYDFLNGDYEPCVEEEQMRGVLEAYGLQYLITTLRKSISASDNGWSAAVCTADSQYHGKTYQLHIVDRVGGGDSFAAGFLHGILSGMGTEKALEFALAAAAIKHTIPGDINYIREAEVLALMDSDGDGRVVR